MGYAKSINAAALRKCLAGPTVRLASTVRAARYLERQCGVWLVRDRIQPGSAEQFALEAA